MSKLHHVQTYSADFDNRSVDASIYTNGGTYHKVIVDTLWDNGHHEREVAKCFSRSKAITIATVRTTRGFGRV